MNNAKVPPEDEEINRGQLRFAKRFANAERDKYIYAHGVGWHQWDGCRWAECQAEEASHAVHDLLDAARWELPHMGDDHERKDMLSDLLKLESSSGVKGTLELARARPGIAVPGNKLNASATHLNTPSGTLDLETGKLAEHSPADRITKITHAPFEEDATSQIWDEFIERILPDVEVREFVQRLFGYSLLGEVREHVLPIFTGSGANGKGTLRDSVMWSLGDYAIEVSPDMLLETRSDRHSTELMDLMGARLVFASETDRGRRFSEATMKRLVGGDPIRARRMHKDPVQFDPSHTMIMLTNKLPEVSGDDPAVWRRILVVPFDVVIPVKERDGTLPGKLKKSSKAILAWIHQGYLDYLGKGLAPPSAVQARTTEYQQISDDLGRFIEEKCVLLDPHLVSVQARELFIHYERWCHSTGEKSMPEKEFSAAMCRRDGITKGASKGRKMYRGIGLQLEMDDEPMLRTVS